MKTTEVRRRTSLKLLVDITMLSLALWLSYMLRFDWDIPALDQRRFLLVFPYTILLQYFFLWYFEVPKFVWKYVSLRELRVIFRALLASTLIMTVMQIGFHQVSYTMPLVGRLVIPYTVVMIDACLSFLFIVGVRVLLRWQAEHTESREHARATQDPTPILLIGAGQAGVLTAKEIERRPNLNLNIVGFIDDDPNKLHTKIMGIPVLGSSGQIGSVADNLNVKEVLITIASAGNNEIRRIVQCCQEAHIKAKVIPGLFEIVSGQLNINRIREVAIEDLLRRAPVRLEMDKIAAILRDREILVTGAGGSIGSELCRQICEFGPRRMILVERSENSLFWIHRELSGKYPNLQFVPFLADIADPARVESLFQLHKPSIILHAAAHKHVPMLEWNAGESIHNNILGTKLVADAADRNGVEAFLMVSTDKAVNPTSIMGTSKRIAEIYIQALSQRSQTRFITVRFGNVLGSVGSVVPIFKQQIAEGGPVTVTHPEMKRYFMTIPEASQLVLQAGTMGSGGEIYVLDMGEPVKISDLARDLITLSGFQPDVDIEIKYTGIRPGEKLFEELTIDGEEVNKTKHEKILVMKFKPFDWEEIRRRIEDLLAFAPTNDVNGIRAQFKLIVPECRFAVPNPGSVSSANNPAVAKPIQPQPSSPSA